MHTNEKPALVPRTAEPEFDVGIYTFPTAKVEVTDAEAGVAGNEKGLLESRKRG